MLLHTTSENELLELEVKVLSASHGEQERKIYKQFAARKKASLNALRPHLDTSSAHALQLSEMLELPMRIGALPEPELEEDDSEDEELDVSDIVNQSNFRSNRGTKKAVPEVSRQREIEDSKVQAQDVDDSEETLDEEEESDEPPTAEPVVAKKKASPRKPAKESSKKKGADSNTTTKRKRQADSPAKNAETPPSPKLSRSSSMGDASQRRASRRIQIPEEVPSARRSSARRNSTQKQEESPRKKRRG